MLLGVGRETYALNNFIRELNNLDLEFITKFILNSNQSEHDMDGLSTIPQGSVIEDADRMSTHSSSYHRSIRAFVTAKSIIPFMIAAWCYDRMKLTINYSLLPSSSPYFLSLLGYPGSSCALVYNIQNYLSSENYYQYRYSQLRQLRMDKELNGVQMIYDEKNKCHKILHNYSLYLVMVFTDDMTYSCFSLLCENIENNSHRPSIIAKLCIEDSKAVEESQSTVYDKFFERALGWYKTVIRGPDPITDDLGFMASKFETVNLLNLDEKQCSSAGICSLPIAICWYHGDRIYFELVYIPQTEFFSIKRDSLGRITVDQNTCERLLSLSAVIGTYSFSLVRKYSQKNHETANSTENDYEIVLNEFIPSEEIKQKCDDEKLFEFVMFSERLMNSHLSTGHTLFEDDDDDDKDKKDTTIPAVSLIDSHLTWTYPGGDIREKLLITTAKIVPLITFYTVALKVKDRYQMECCVVYKDPSAVHCLFKGGSIDDSIKKEANTSKVAFLDVGVQFQMSKNIFAANESNKSRSRGQGRQLLLPTSKITIIDVTSPPKVEEVLDFVLLMSQPQSVCDILDRHCSL